MGVRPGAGASESGPRLARETAAITTDEETRLPDWVFRQFLDRCPAVFYLKDRELRHLFGSRHLLEKFGINEAEFEGTRTGDYFPPEISESVEELDRQVLAGEVRSPPGDLRSNCYPGWYYDVKFPLDGPDGTLIGGLAIDLTDRVLAERVALEQVGFERLIADLASRLARTLPEELDEAIDFTLRSLGEFLEVERSFFGRFSADRSSLTMPHTWQAAGVEPPGTEVVGSNLAEAFPWAAEQIAANRVIKAGPGLSGLPEGARDLRRQLERDGIKSGVLVPILVEGQALGFIGLDSMSEGRDYPEPLVERLRIVADVLGATIARAEAEVELRSSLAEVKRLKHRLESENLYLREEIALESGAGRIVGDSDALSRVLEDAREVATTDSTVLLGGETGTGKELLARFIHRASRRADRPLVKVSCATLPETLVESELFGRERGAYTGAMTRQTGRFEVADGSTIFLDEIGDLPLGTQVKLLRVLEEGELERLGSSKTLHVDVRVIAATNRDLQADVEAGRFRKDLYYRLNVFPLTLPPLRDRPGDVRLLTWAFVQELARSMGKRVDDITRESMRALESYPWPGNVRELRNVIERAMIRCHASTLEVPLPEAPRGAGESGDDSSLDGAQRRHILRVLDQTGWRVRGRGGAAELLEMKPSTLENRMKKLEIRRPG